MLMGKPDEIPRLMVTARIFSEHPEFDTVLNRIRTAGLRYFQSKSGSLVVELPRVDSLSQPNKFDIPRELPRDALFTVQATEEGGAITEREGYAQLVTTLNGRRTRTVRHISNQPGGVQGVFVMPEAVVTVHAHRQTDEKSETYGLRIMRHHLAFTGPVALIESSVIWRDTVETRSPQMPYDVSEFGDAVYAAIDKTLCRDCRDVHYAEGHALPPRVLLDTYSAPKTSRHKMTLRDVAREIVAGFIERDIEAFRSEPTDQEKRDMDYVENILSEYWEVVSDEISKKA